MLHKAWNSQGEIPYCFPRSSIKFQGHTVQNITDFDPNWAFPVYGPVAAFKSLRFALFILVIMAAISYNVSHQTVRGYKIQAIFLETTLYTRGSPKWIFFVTIVITTSRNTVFFFFIKLRLSNTRWIHLVLYPNLRQAWNRLTTLKSFICGPAAINLKLWAR